MSQKAIKGSKQIADQIKFRRHELNLTIEEAALKAGVGTKTWCRYEAGGSIRCDKYRGICKALNWHAFPEDNPEDNTVFNLEEYQHHEAWSRYLETEYGILPALSFAVGSDILLDHLEEDIGELSTYPKDSHIGQLNFSWLKSSLPQQFLMQYNYDFLYCLRSTVMHFRNIAQTGDVFIARSVLEELTLYLIMDESQMFIESELSAIVASGIEYNETWDDWVFDIFDDMDIVTFLYSECYLMEDNPYHFKNWTNQQFWC